MVEGIVPARERNLAATSDFSSSRSPLLGSSVYDVHENHWRLSRIGVSGNRVPAVHLNGANSVFFAFFSFNRTNNLRIFSVAPNPIPTRASNISGLHENPPIGRRLVHPIKSPFAA
jgi:hypothetical protein